MLKFIMRCISVIYYVHFPLLEWLFPSWSGKVDIVNDAVTTKPNLGLATNSREWRGLTQRENYITRGISSVIFYKIKASKRGCVTEKFILKEGPLYT